MKKGSKAGVCSGVAGRSFGGWSSAERGGGGVSAGLLLVGGFSLVGVSGDRGFGADICYGDSSHDGPLLFHNFWE